MMSVSRISFVALAAVILLTTTASASIAQQDPVSNRPYRGVFGGGLDNTEQSLTVTGSLGTGYDTDIHAAFRGDTTATDGTLRPRVGGMASFGSGSVNYSLGRERVSLGVSGTTTVYVYNEGGTQYLRSHGVSASQGFRFSSRTQLTASQSLSYEPFSVGGLFPTVESSFGAPVLPSPDGFLSDDSYAYLNGTVDLTHQVTNTLSVYGGYGLESSGALGGRQDFHTGRGGMTVGVARGLGIRVGYGYSQGGFGEVSDDRQVHHHTIDAGVDFNRALSLSRRTTLSFSTGSTAIRDGQQTHFRLTGSAQLDHAIGRSWHASLGYARDVEFLQQLQEVMFSDSLNVAIGGLLNRRQSFHAGAGMSIGAVGFSGVDNDASTAFGTVGLMTAINRSAGLGVDYNFYIHSFGTSVALPSGVLHDVDRHSLRAYVSLWAPLFSRARSSNASR